MRSIQRILRLIKHTKDEESYAELKHKVEELEAHLKRVMEENELHLNTVRMERDARNDERGGSKARQRIGRLERGQQRRQPDAAREQADGRASNGCDPLPAVRPKCQDRESDGHELHPEDADRPRLHLMTEDVPRIQDVARAAWREHGQRRKEQRGNLAQGEGFEPFFETSGHDDAG